MTDAEDQVAAIARAANDLVPQLTDRLVRLGLGEIEVSSGDLRLRVARATGVSGVSANVEQGGQPVSVVAPAVSPALAGGSPSIGVASPAVGFFVYADGLGPGLAVDKGDALGQVEMLGIRHDVRAPRRGTIRHLVAESGEAVEYGQVVVELEAQEMIR